MATTGRRRRGSRAHAYFIAGCVCWAGVFAGWALFSSTAGAVAVNVLGGVAFALTAVSTVVIVDELVPLRLRATGQTLSRAVGGGLAPVVGNVAGGLVYGAAGPGPMFGLTAACAGVAAVTAVAALRLRR
jgi:hypothetical protein